MRNIKENQQGIVLVITLWVIVVLSIVALSYVKQVRMEIKMVGFQRDVTVVEELAKVGLRQAVILLQEDKIKDSGEDRFSTVFSFKEDDVFSYDGGNEAWAEGEVDNDNLYIDFPFYEAGEKVGYYYVTVEDESAKFPINNMKTNIEQIARLIELTGVEEDEAMHLAGALIDWRDRDSVVTDTGESSFGRDGSDEVAYYNPRQRRSRNEVEIPEVMIKNAPLETVDELLLIPGMTPEIVFGTIDPNEQQSRGRFGRRHLRKGEYLGLANFLTVYTNRINLNTVKPEVFEAILYPTLGDSAESLALEWADYRDGRDGIIYTADDHVLKTIDNSDMDDMHFTEVNGFTEDIMKFLTESYASISSNKFTVTCMAEYEGIQKGYRAIVARTYIPWDRLPVFGVDTFELSDLQQSRAHIRFIEPLYNVREQIEKLS